MKAKKGTELGIAQKQAKLGGKCNRCGEIHPELNVDHVVPVFLLEMLGVRIEGAQDDAENLELICRRCNQLKGSKLQFNNPKTFHLVRKYIDLSERLYGIKV